ncbi:50S ribosomal protein L18 [archaeon]|jgi:large subunit ribosomal protein L18|nr:50S ribosomal protein L18 [archaeon]
MSNSKTYTVGYRRKRQKKTDYKKRLKQVVSDRVRIVIRQSTNSMIIQAVKFNESGDETLKYITTADLKKYGWTENLGNTSSAYLTGLLFGKLAKDVAKDGIIDLGLRRLVKKSRIAAAIKGIIDSGLDVPASESIFPGDEKVTGKTNKKDISAHFEEVKKKVEGVK